MNPSDRTTPRQQFLHRLAQAQAQGLWHRLVLSRPHSAEHGVLRTTVRPISLKGQPTMSFVDSHATRDVTKNLPAPAGLARVDELVGDVFRNAHLFTTTAELQLKLGKKGRGDAGHLTEHALAPAGDKADAPSPPSTFCQLKVVTSSLAQSISIAKAEEVASQMVRPLRSAGMASAFGTRQPEVVPFQVKTTSRSKSTFEKSTISP